MAHPKRRTSSAVRDKRRTHYKLIPKAVTLCPNTLEVFDALGNGHGRRGLDR